MSRPLYTKVTEGVVEQIYDDEGQCVGQQFVPFEGKATDRRMIRLDGEEVGPDDLDNDEIIDHPEDIKALEERERFQPYDMVQPQPDAK